MSIRSEKPTVVVGMSGGVDSSVAAAILLEDGYNVVGVTMKTYDFAPDVASRASETSCCGLGAVNDARLVASQLGIPHYVVDFRQAFEREVVGNFVAEYLKGRTPNPCVICNREIKWGELMRKADLLGASYIATGHYARVRRDAKSGRYVVSRSTHARKDQSYALWGVSQEALSRTIFPLGERSKIEVRQQARRLGLRTAEKDESFEICFVPDDRYETFLRGRPEVSAAGIQNGELVHDGSVVGTHRGYPFYTIGQRRGVGAHGRKMYVTAIEKERNRVHIGTGDELLHRGLLASQVRWGKVESVGVPRRVQAMVRYRDEPSDAVISPKSDGGVYVEFDRPKRAITPGQSVVIYEGDDVLGGGIIEQAVP